MRFEVNSKQFEISLRNKISLRCKVTYQRSNDLKQSKTHFGANFTSFNLTEVKFQTTVSFSCKQQMLAMK